MPELIKQNVQWFPGHMAKTRRLIKESLNLVDGVVEILDARVPYSSQNPELDGIIKNKPRIILLNKCDVANPTATSMWIKYFESKGAYAIPVDCKTGKGLNKFDEVVKKALARVIAKNEEKGMTGKPLRLMVVGIPNTGKSSFINRMGKNAKAKVADKAGVTRQNQWFIVGNGIELLDTPGVLWPKLDNEKVALNLAYTGTIKSDVIDEEEIAYNLTKLLLSDYKNNLINRYELNEQIVDKILQNEDIAENERIVEVMTYIGEKKNLLKKGGEVDFIRTSRTILEDFRSANLGRITLERVKE